MPIVDSRRTLGPDEREMIRKNWGVFVALGAVIALLGIAGLMFTAVFTLGIVALLGWLFVVSGALEVGHAIARKGWSGFWVDLLDGVLSLVVGAMILMQPVTAIAVLTVFIGIIFLIGGIFRLWAGVALRASYGLLVVLHGGISILLGVMILANWPYSSVWVIGTLVAIDMIFSGSRMITLGATARTWPAANTSTP